MPIKAMPGILTVGMINIALDLNSIKTSSLQKSNQNGNSRGCLLRPITSLAPLLL